ncbi:MAG: hypothetical protein SX243_24045 [Acidobacteriota bacterium]|nr:hypothetical protein [Acidobacteriota bacterium]
MSELDTSLDQEDTKELDVPSFSSPAQQEDAGEASSKPASQEATEDSPAAPAGSGLLRDPSLKHSQWVQAEDLEIVFVDAAPPPLPAGDFRLALDETLAWDGGSADAIHSEYDFTVNGPRFTLDPALVHSMFPPPGNRGHFQKYLPHLVFDRRSLPWERTVDGSLPQDKPFVPWLWLLSLDASEINADPQNPIAIQTVTVTQLLNPPARVLGPHLAFETGEDLDSQLMVVDVPTALINQLVPSREDLIYTAGARLVSVMNKELTATTETGWFSAVVANRFPANGQSNTQFLVSMEGYGTEETDIFFPNQVDPAKYDAVRFVVLLSWTFENVDDDQTFDQLTAGLSVDRLQLPGTGAHNQITSNQVASAFSMGYTALNHTTRQGEPNVSWYRGPMLPLTMPKNTPDSYANGDAALRFDPATGLFDVSYAAAWQVGRLLGLQDGEFAAAIARLRDDHQNALMTLASRSFLMHRLSFRLPLPEDFQELLGRQVFDRAWMKAWGQVLGPRLVPPAGEDRPPLLGAPADPSGLERRRPSLPGLLERSEVLEVLEQPPDEVLDALLAKIHRGGKR